jgi:hypothetical protein
LRRDAVSSGAGAADECHTEQEQHDAENAAVLRHQGSAAEASPQAGQGQVETQKVSVSFGEYCPLYGELNFPQFATLEGPLCAPANLLLRDEPGPECDQNRREVLDEEGDPELEPSLIMAQVDMSNVDNTGNKPSDRVSSLAA